MKVKRQINEKKGAAQAKRMCFIVRKVEQCTLFVFFRSLFLYLYEYVLHLLPARDTTFCLSPPFDFFLHFSVTLTPFVCAPFLYSPPLSQTQCFSPGMNVPSGFYHCSSPLTPLTPPGPIRMKYWTGRAPSRHLAASQSVPRPAEMKDNNVRTQLPQAPGPPLKHHTPSSTSIVFQLAAKFPRRLFKVNILVILYFDLIKGLLGFSLWPISLGCPVNQSFSIQRQIKYSIQTYFLGYNVRSSRRFFFDQKYIFVCFCFVLFCRTVTFMNNNFVAKPAVFYAKYSLHGIRAHWTKGL